jgi:hypothetical protein
MSEPRQVIISLESAKEWYKGDNLTLKNIALQAYTEQELEGTSWENIKTYEDACEALGIKKDIILHCDDDIARGHAMAIYRLEIIRKALNEDWKPSLFSGEFCCPMIKFYKKYDDAKSTARNNDWKFCGKVEIEGSFYYMVGGSYISYINGLSCFGCDFGTINANLGLLCCKSGEIAQHMSKYFAKEIFDAIYMQYNNYIWVEDDEEKI